MVFVLGDGERQEWSKIIKVFKEDIELWNNTFKDKKI